MLATVGGPQLQVTPTPSMRELDCECCVCMDAAVATQLLPCSHEILCANCAAILVALGKGCPACRATIVDFSTSDTFGRAGIYDSNSKEQQRASKDRLAREFLRYRLWDPRHDTSAHAAPPFWHGKVSRKVAEDRLIRPGDFLVRASGFLRSKYVLSCRLSTRQVLHLSIVEDRGRIVLGFTEYPTVGAMLYALLQGTGGTALQLLRPVPKPNCTVTLV